MIENDNEVLYPQKPQLNQSEDKKPWFTTLFSLILFVITFVYFFSDQILFLIILVSALVIHELGHFIFMKLFKYKKISMVFVPLMGAFVDGRKKKYSQYESLLVVAAGPFPGMIIGLILLLAYGFHPNQLFFLSALIFIALNAINLLPLDPLDGGQLFRLLLSKQSDLFMVVFSFISSLIMILIGFLMQNWYMVGFGFFLAIRVRSFQKRYSIRKIFKQNNINYVLDYSNLSNKDYSRMKEIILRDNKLLRKIRAIDSLEDSDIIISSEVNHYLEAPMSNDASSLLKLGIVLFWILSFLIPVYFMQKVNPFLFDYDIFFR